MSVDVAALGTILSVWAHPDDETFGCAGIMAVASDNGQRVVCVTATRGEGGSLDHERWPPSELAAVREAELDEALRIIGSVEHHWLGYPDGGCADVAVDEAVRRIAALIREVQPQTVLSFGPDGGTWHPDHIATSGWTRAAFDDAAPPGAKLLQVTQSPQFWSRLTEVVPPEVVMMADRDPVLVEPADCELYAVWDGEVLDRKERALLAQVSQTERLVQMAGRDFFRELLAEEAYVLAAVQPTLG